MSMDTVRAASGQRRGAAAAASPLLDKAVGVGAQAELLGEDRVDLGARKVAPVRGLDCGLWDWGLVEKGAVAYNLHDRRMTQRGLKRGGGRADARPCGVGEYLYWYVSGKCGKMEE